MELHPGIEARCIDATEEVPMPMDQPQGFRIANEEMTWWLCVDPEDFDSPDNEYKMSKDGRHNTWLDAVAAELSGGIPAEKDGSKGSKSTLEKMQFDRNGNFLGVEQISHGVDQHGPPGHRALHTGRKDPSCQFWGQLEVSLPEESKQDGHLKAWIAAAGLIRHPTQRTYRVSVPLRFDEFTKTFSLEPRLGCWSHFLSDPSQLKRSFDLKEINLVQNSNNESSSSDVHRRALRQWNGVKNARRGVAGFVSAAASAAAATASAAKAGTAGTQNDGNQLETTPAEMQEDHRVGVHDIELESLRADIRRMAKSISTLEKFVKERLEALERAVQSQSDATRLRLSSNVSTVTIEADAHHS